MTENEKLERLRRFHDLYENALFQEWTASIREELAALKELPWASIEPRFDAKRSEALSSCGLHTPQDAKDFYETFSVVRGVIHYVEGKLGDIERKSKQYIKLLEKIQERIRDEVDNG